MSTEPTKSRFFRIDLENIVWVVCVFILIVLFAGEPDIADAIMYALTDGAIAPKALVK